MNQKWTRAICTVLTSALVFTGPAVEGTTFSGYINSGLEKVYAKTQKQKDAEKKKSQAEQDLKDKKNEINGLKDQQQTTADDIKNKSAKLDEILAAQKKLQTDIYADTMYPNDMRPQDNHGYQTQYRGMDQNR